MLLKELRIANELLREQNNRLRLPPESLYTDELVSYLKTYLPLSQNRYSRNREAASVAYP